MSVIRDSTHVCICGRVYMCWFSVFCPVVFFTAWCLTAFLISAVVSSLYRLFFGSILFVSHTPVRPTSFLYSLFAVSVAFMTMFTVVFILSRLMVVGGLSCAFGVLVIVDFCTSCTC